MKGKFIYSKIDDYYSEHLAELSLPTIILTSSSFTIKKGKAIFDSLLILSFQTNENTV